MKFIFILIITAFPLFALADSSTPEGLAKDYVAAVQSKDLAVFKKLVHPKFLASLTPAEAKLIDAGIQSLLADADQLKDPMWIRTKELSPKDQASLSTEELWKVLPEVQIEMQPYRKVSDAKEATGYMAVQFAAKHEGKYYLVFQLPKTP